MTENPLLLLIMITGGFYLGWLWRTDARSASQGHPKPNALPGATPARPLSIAIAVTGAVVLLVIETAGEMALGLAAQQSTITGLFALYTLTAAIIEEIIFRGYLVVENRGATARWLAAVAASVVFALFHPFLWQWNEQGFAFTLGAKGAFSTAIVFATSLWLYFARFAAWNPTQSLLPCIAAHAAKNAGVIAIKASQGFLAGWW